MQRIPNSSGVCTACGMEGQATCPGSTCQGTDLHLNFQGGQIVCTWMCGHAQGAPCPMSTLPFCSGSPSTLTQLQGECVVPLTGNDLTNGGIYACYDGGMLDNLTDCACTPNTKNRCPDSTSIPTNGQNFGTCTLGKFAYTNPTNPATYGPTCP